MASFFAVGRRLVIATVVLALSLVTVALGASPARADTVMP